MSDQTLKYTLDVVTLLLGIWIMVKLFRSSVGGALGTSFRLIWVGIFVLAINHLVDTAYLSDALEVTGSTNALFTAPFVHRVINFVGFVVMGIGFKKFVDISTKAGSSN